MDRILFILERMLKESIPAQKGKRVQQMRIGVCIIAMACVGFGAYSEAYTLPSLEEREVLPAAELEQVLAEGARLREEGLHACGTYLVGKCSVRLDRAGARPAGWILRCGNPEIAEEIIKVYIAEYQMGLRQRIIDYEQAPIADSHRLPEAVNSKNNEVDRMLLDQSIAQDGQLYRESDLAESKRRGEAEDAGEYLIHLASLAESTLSPKIYEYVWNCPFPGKWRNLYLAAVKPEDTLRHIQTATVAERLGSPRPNAANCLFRADTGASLQESDAMAVLALMASANPGFAVERREAFIALVRRHGLSYSPSNSGGKYSERRDLLSRLHALEIIEVVGVSSDISLVESLMAEGSGGESPQPSPGPHSEEINPARIAEKSGALINLLRQRETPAPLKP